jgi:hypothetical protein
MGDTQEIGTLMNEEVLLFPEYIRDEKETWNPKIAVPNQPFFVLITYTREKATYKSMFSNTARDGVGLECH